MSADRLRAAMIGLLVAAAVASTIARKTGQGWVTAISFTLFGLGVLAYFRWRQLLHARVLDREDKTS